MALACGYFPHSPEERARDLRRWRAEAVARASGAYVPCSATVVGEILQIPTGDGWQLLRVDGHATERELWKELDVDDPVAEYPGRAEHIRVTLDRIWARVTYLEADGVTPARWSDDTIRTDIVHEACRRPSPDARPAEESPRC